MDGHRFDEMTRRLGAGLSRRQLVRGLLGGAGALAGSTVLKQVGSAQGPCIGRPCTDQGDCCTAFSCSTEGICVCFSGHALCPETDSCYPIEGGCCDASQCGSGQACESNSCVNIDPCDGVQCGPCEFCDDGDCISNCSTGQTCVNDQCVDDDPCANVECGLCETCDASGVCQSDCSGNDVCCEATGACYDPATACCTNDDCLTAPCLECEGGACVQIGEWCEGRQVCYNPETNCCTDDQCDAQPGGFCANGDCFYQTCVDAAGAACNPSIEGQDCCSGLTCSGDDVPGSGGICCPNEWCPLTNTCYSTMAGGCCTDAECGDDVCVDNQCQAPTCLAFGESCVVAVDVVVAADDPCCDPFVCLTEGEGAGTCGCPGAYCPDTNTCYEGTLGTCCTSVQCPGDGVCVNNACKYPTCVETEGAVCNPSVEDEDCCEGLTCSGVGEPGSSGICCPFEFCPETWTCYHTMAGGCCYDHECGDDVCIDNVCVPVCKEKGEHCEYEDDCCHGLFCGHKDKCREHCKEIHDHCKHDHDCCDHLVCHHGKCKDPKPHCVEKHHHCKHDHDCCHGLLCLHGVCDKKKRPHRPKPQPKPVQPVGGTTVRVLPDTGTGDAAGESGWTGAALASGAAALFAAKFLRRKAAEERPSDSES